MFDFTAFKRREDFEHGSLRLLLGRGTRSALQNCLQQIYIQDQRPASETHYKIPSDALQDFLSAIRCCRARFPTPRAAPWALWHAAARGCPRAQITPPFFKSGRPGGAAEHDDGARGAPRREMPLVTGAGPGAALTFRAALRVWAGALRRAAWSARSASPCLSSASTSGLASGSAAAASSGSSTKRFSSY